MQCNSTGTGCRGNLLTSVSSQLKLHHAQTVSADAAFSVMKVFRESQQDMGYLAEAFQEDEWRTYGDD